GRIAEDVVESRFGRLGRQDVAFDECNAIGDAVALSVAAAAQEGGRSDVDCGHLRGRHVFGGTNGQDAAAGAHIADCDGGFSRRARFHALEQCDNQQLCFRTRYQDVRVYLEVERVELATA